MGKLKRILKSFIKVKINLIIVFILIVGTLISPFFYYKMLRAYVSPSVYLITNLGDSRGFGTGFAVKAPNGKTYLATNNHVCSGLKVGNKIVALTDTSVETHVLKVLLQDPENDLCIAEAPANASGLSISVGFAVGDTVHVIGHPLGGSLHRNDGEIIAHKIIQINYGNYFLPDIKFMSAWQFSATTSPGNSGSPVVNFFGRVIGIQFAGSSGNSYTSFLIASKYLLEDLSRLK